MSRTDRLNALLGVDQDSNNTDSDDDANQRVDRLTVKSMECIQWYFCVIFMMSFDPQSRMEIVDFGEGAIIRNMIAFFVILKYLIDHNLDSLDVIKCFDRIRCIFLVIKKLSKTVPFPWNLYNGHRGAIMLVAEILIYTEKLRVKLKLKPHDNNT